MGQQGHRPIYFRLRIVGSMVTVRTNMVQSGPTHFVKVVRCLTQLTRCLTRPCPCYLPDPTWMSYMETKINFRKYISKNFCNHKPKWPER